MEVKVEIKKVLVKDLKYAPYNPRKISDEVFNKLKQSIEEFGYIEPIVVNKRTRHVVGGNQRLKALEDLGIEEVEAVFVDLDDAREKALNIALNKITGEWDYPKLKDLLEELDTGAFDIELTGFDLPEIEDLMTQFYIEETKDAEPQLDKVEELRKQWGVETGQLWQCGEHLIICGDCRDKKIINKIMGKNKAELLFTDPPYGINIINKKGKIGGDVLAKNKIYHSIEGDNKPFDPSFLWNLSQAFILWGANYFLDKLPHCGQWLVWDKGRPEGTTFSEAELAWTSDKGRVVRIYRCVWNGMIREGEAGERYHPAQKPVKLFMDILSDRKEHVVLDPFLGSGTTIIACENLRRKCRGVEISPDYVAVCLQRYKDVTNKEPILVE